MALARSPKRLIADLKFRGTPASVWVKSRLNKSRLNKSRLNKSRLDTSRLDRSRCMGRSFCLLLIVALWGCDGQPPAAVFLADPNEQIPNEQASAGDVADSAETGDGLLKQRHDFGVVKPSVTLMHDFVIENKTASDWTLAGVKTDCSCTIATPDWKVIPAGQKKLVTVELSTGSAIRFQPVTHTVEVKFREASVEPARLSVSALVRDVLYITPERVVLADVGKGTTVTRSIIVSNFGDQKITPPRFTASVPWVTSAKPVVESVEDGMPSSPLQRFRYDIQLVGKTLALGHHEASITFESNTEAKPPPIAVVVDIRQSIAAIPSRAFFGRIAPGQSGAMTIVIRSPENSSLDESAIRIESELPGQLTWKIVKQSANTALLSLTLKPTATEGLVHGEFAIVYRDSRIPVPVDALVTPE